MLILFLDLRHSTERSDTLIIFLIVFHIIIVIVDVLCLFSSTPFEDCTNLSSVTIKDNVQNIGNNAFRGCDNIVINCEKGSATYVYAIMSDIKYKLIEIISGDANGDGKTTVADIVEMQKYLTNFKTITKEVFKQLDLNNDGKFNVFNLIILKRKIINAAK